MEERGRGGAERRPALSKQGTRACGSFMTVGASGSMMDVDKLCSPLCFLVVLKSYISHRCLSLSECRRSSLHSDWLVLNFVT